MTTTIAREDLAGIRWVTPAVLADQAAAHTVAQARRRMEAELSAAERTVTDAWAEAEPDVERIKTLGADVAALRASLEAAPPGDGAPSLRHVYEAACATLQALGGKVIAIEPAGWSTQLRQHGTQPVADQYEALARDASTWSTAARRWMQAEQQSLSPDLHEAERLACEAEALVERGQASVRQDPDIAARRNVRRQVVTLFGAKREVLASSIVI